MGTANFSELQPGTKLCGGKYIIERKLGAGGFGITYKATQQGLNKIVCIKEYFLAGRCVRNSATCAIDIQGDNDKVFTKYREAFVREAKLIATLHHPNIVEVTDVFDENNTSYMVMEYIEGRSLQDLVEKRGKLPYPEVVNYIAQITSAAGYIHRRHILHRDIKPDNIMITADYKAILIDFGSAREFEQDKTQHHTSMVTHGYAPIEQYSSNSRKGSYTDIYAIGATMYFALTAEVPEVASSRFENKMKEPKELNPEIPVEANRTIMKAMQIKAENRHQTVDTFMDDLRNVKPSVIVDEQIGGKKNKWLLPVLIAGAVVICGLVGFLVFGPSKEKVVEIDNGLKTYDFTNGLDYPMVFVEGGTFTMGNNEMNEEEEDCIEHQVTLSNFYIGQFEVSRRLWKEVMGYDPSLNNPEEDDNGRSITNSSYYDNLPVENITIDEAQEFVRRLNNRTGEQFAIPTEAQWEYAARGGKHSNDYYFAGVDISAHIRYYTDYPLAVDYDGGINEIGAYNMSGNIAEWCIDTYDEYFYKNSRNAKNPVCYDGYDNVFRGGSYDDTKDRNISVYYRNYSDDAEPYIGLRLVLKK